MRRMRNSALCLYYNFLLSFRIELQSFISFATLCIARHIQFELRHMFVFHDCRVRCELELALLPLCCFLVTSEITIFECVVGSSPCLLYYLLLYPPC